MDEKGIFWLASFPKSGNTWFRIVLSNLLNKKEKLENLDEINTGNIASGRLWIDDALGFDSSFLHDDELDQILPLVYQYYHDSAEKVSYHKIHHAYTYLDKDNKKPLIPPCLGAVYIMRNPLDVVISFANHSQCSLGEAINALGNDKLTYCANPFIQEDQTRHFLGSWSFHVESWLNAKINLLFIRYEDMKAYPQETFTKAFEFLRIKATQEEINLAINNAQIEKLQNLEDKLGFKERPTKTKKFFRKGVVGDWMEQLSAPEIRQLVKDHAAVMNKHGYLDPILLNYI